MMKLDDEMYFSIDVESDGPIPGPNSMLSFGVSAYALESESWRSCGTYEANLVLLPGATPNPDTMRFWADNVAAYEATRVNVREPASVMPEFADWVAATSGKRRPVAVAYPATFDGMFVYWYLMRFAGRSPFGFQVLDCKTLAMALLRKPFRQSTKRVFPRSWFGDRRHSHVALDDAIEQGEMFCRMMDELRRRPT